MSATATLTPATSFPRLAASPEPYVATCGVETVESDDCLAHLLVSLAEILDDDGPDDVVVWHGRRVVMIFRADGSVTDFCPTHES